MNAEGGGPIAAALNPSELQQLDDTVGEALLAENDGQVGDNFSRHYPGYWRGLWSAADTVNAAPRMRYSLANWMEALWRRRWWWHC